MKYAYVGNLKKVALVATPKTEVFACVHFAADNDNHKGNTRICPDCGWSGWPCLCEGDMA